MVLIHQEIRAVNKGLKKQAQINNVISPRDFMDFIRHFQRLVQEKTKTFQETEGHYGEGIRTIEQTENSVSVLRQELTVFSQELEIKKENANIKLEQIIDQKRESNNQIEISKSLQIQINQKQEEIAVSQSKINEELRDIEPKLNQAKEAVSKINQQALGELKNYQQPPTKVKMTLEAVVLILHGQKKDWAEIKKIMGKSDFIESILKFNIENTKESVKQIIQKEFLGNPEWDIEQINRSSKAAGPLAEWLQSQISYKEILLMVEPLTKQVREMEGQSLQLKNQMEQLIAKIEQLESNIKMY